MMSPQQQPRYQWQWACIGCWRSCYTRFGLTNVGNYHQQRKNQVSLPVSGRPGDSNTSSRALQAEHLRPGCMYLYAKIDARIYAQCFTGMALRAKGWRTDGAGTAKSILPGWLYRSGTRPFTAFLMWFKGQICGQESGAVAGLGTRLPCFCWDCWYMVSTYIRTLASTKMNNDNMIRMQIGVLSQCFKAHSFLSSSDSNCVWMSQ